jgi:hypothetical protein
VRKKRYTEGQTIGLLREAQAGMAVANVCRSRRVHYRLLRLADEVRGRGGQRCQAGVRARGGESAAEALDVQLPQELNRKKSHTCCSTSRTPGDTGTQGGKVGAG